MKTLQDGELNPLSGFTTLEDYSQKRYDRHSPLFEIALVLVRFDHTASVITSSS
jgi:hypothetical protein